MARSASAPPALIAIDPGSELRGLLDRLGAAPYQVALSCDAVCRRPPPARTVIVTPADCLPRVLSCCPGAAAIAIAQADAPQARDCLRAGAFCFFSEPIPAGAFREVLQNALTGGDWHEDVAPLSAGPDWTTLRVRCKLSLLDRLLQWLREIECDLPPKSRDDVLTAMRELISNAIEHGGRRDPAKTVTISRVHARRACIYHIEDPGPGFSLADVPHAAISNSPGDPVRHSYVRSERGLRPGGFGIMLSRSLADELIYNEKGNQVALIKYL